MRFYSKLALPVLSCCLALPLAYGQSDAPPPPQPAAQMQPGPGGQFMRHRMEMRRMDFRGNGSFGGQWGHHNHWMGMRHRRDFMLARLVRNPEFRQRLGVTDAQAQKIQSQTFDFRKAQIQSFADLAVKRLEFQSLLATTNPDRNAIDQKLQQISDARLAMAKAAVNYHLDMRAALTPDQWQKLRQMRQEFFRRRFGAPGPNGPAPASGMHSNGANG